MCLCLVVQAMLVVEVFVILSMLWCLLVQAEFCVICALMCHCCVCVVLFNVAVFVCLSKVL